MARFRKFFLTWILCFPLSLFAQGKLYLSGYGGGSLHFPATMHLQLGGFDYTTREVQFSSHSFEFPLYYGISLGKEIFASRIAFEFIHDKAFVRHSRLVRIVESNNPQIPSGMRLPFELLLSRFSVSHGCNFLLVNYAHRFFMRGNGFSGYGGIGLGVLVPHVESQHFQKKKAQYEIHFPSGMVDWIFQRKMAKKFSLVGGWKVTMARISHAKIVNGNASFWIWGLHGILGVEIYP